MFPKPIKKPISGHVERLYPSTNLNPTNNEDAFLNNAERSELLGIPEQQQQQHKNPNQIISPDLKYISRQLSSIKLDLNEIKKCFKPSNNFKISLPIDSQQNLDEIISNLEDEDFTLNLTKYLKSFVPEEGKHHSTGLSKLITDRLLKEYNWDGLNSKTPLKDIPLFNKILYDAWKGSFKSHAEFERSLKKQIFDSHNRENRRKSRLRLLSD